MKKIHVFLLSLVLIFGCLVACDHNPKVKPTPTPEPVVKNEVWQVGDKTFETLQEAVDSISANTTKAPVDITIKLLKDGETGPGAVIDEKSFIIDFNGNSFTFSGDFGLQVGGTAEVILTNSSDSEITLENDDEGLTLVEVDGSEGAEVYIEDSTNLTVVIGQYVLKVNNGALLTAGTSESDRVKLHGLIHAEGGSKITITHYTTAKTENVSVKDDDTVVTISTDKLSEDDTTGLVEIAEITRLDNSSAKVVIATKGTEISVIVNTGKPEGSVVDDSEATANSFSYSSYAITYETNGGTINEAHLTTYHTSETGSVTLPSDVTKAGMTFAGWFDNESFEGDKVTEFPITLAGGDKVFYAKWVYTVSYDSNGGTEGTVPEAQEVVDGSDVVIRTNSGNLAKPECVFVGWNTVVDGTGKHVDAGSTVDGGFVGDTTLYAQWRDYPIVVLSAGTGISSVSGGGKYAPGSEVTIDAEVAAGYTWNNWTAGHDVVSSNKPYTFKIGNDDVSYTAHATPNHHTIKYFMNSNSSDNTVLFEHSQAYDSHYVLPEDPVREDYRFDGWFTGRTDGTQITVDNVAKITADQNLYAHWTRVVRVTLMANNGSFTYVEQDIELETDATIESIGTTGFAAPANKVFAGWTTKENGYGDYYEDEAKVNLSDELTLYAQWGLDLNDNSTVPTKSAWNNSETYVLTADMTLADDRIIVGGDVKLYLLKGTTLTASKGIGVHTGNSLTIHGKGTLTANGTIDKSAIGGSGVTAAQPNNHCGTITINGGIINATGGGFAPGIGECANVYSEPFTSPSEEFKIFINGGEVNATGGSRGPGIGAAYAGKKPNGTLTVSGGKVNATAGYYHSAGIGGGYQTGGIKVIVKGGTIIARGNEDNVAIGKCEHPNYSSMLNSGSLYFDPPSGKKISIYTTDSKTATEHPYTMAGYVSSNFSNYMRIETKDL